MNDQSKHSDERKLDFLIDIVRSLLFPLIAVKVDQELTRLEQEVVQLSAWVGVFFGLSFPESRCIQLLLISKDISIHTSKWYHIFFCSAYIRIYWPDSRHRIKMLSSFWYPIPPVLQRIHVNISWPFLTEYIVETKEDA